MQIDGLIPFKSSTYQAIASLYLLRISTSLCSLSFVKSAAIITGFDISTPRKAYFKCLGNSFRINPVEHFSTSCAFSSHYLIFLHFFIKTKYFFLIQPWYSDVQNQEPQYTRNSSYFHSLNLDYYNHQLVHN